MSHRHQVARAAAIARAQSELRKLQDAVPSDAWTAEDIEQARAIWTAQLQDLQDPLPIPAPARTVLRRRGSGALWAEAA